MKPKRSQLPGRPIPVTAEPSGRGTGREVCKSDATPPYEGWQAAASSGCESLLKWLPALYRRAEPTGICDNLLRSSRALGRSQAVRQRILIPPFGGSIPPAPATPLLDLGLWSIHTRKYCISRGFRVFWIGLQTPKIGNLGENLSKVSGPSAEYSRFRETLRGDFFDRHCVRGVAGDLYVAWWSGLQYDPSDRLIARFPSDPFISLGNFLVCHSGMRAVDFGLRRRISPI
jgi:hypothetical protein